MAKTKSKSNKPHPHHVPIGVSVLIGIVFVATLALLFVWKQVPRPSPPAPSYAEKIPEVKTPPPVAEPAPPSGPVRARPEGMICDELNFICVDEEVKDSLLANPFIVKGSGLAFENTINWRLLDGNGGKLEESFVTASAPDVGKAGDFEIRAFMLHAATTRTGTLEVFEYSAKDGTPIHIVKIPIKLPSTTMKTRFYMPIASGTNDCSAVSSVEVDVPKSALPVETALRALLAIGPTMSSKRSAIPLGTKLESLVVSGGIAKAVFSSELENYGGGSCNVQAIRAQIEQTLMQFSSIDDVMISVVGKTPAQTLQP